MDTYNIRFHIVSYTAEQPNQNALVGYMDPLNPYQ